MLIINFSILALACYTAAAVPFCKINTFFNTSQEKSNNFTPISMDNHKFETKKTHFEPVIRVMVKGEKTNKINVIGYFYGRSSLPWQFKKNLLEQ